LHLHRVCAYFCIAMQFCIFLHWRACSQFYIVSYLFHFSYAHMLLQKLYFKMQYCKTCKQNAKYCLMQTKCNMQNIT
jgi:hypothetical protein